MIFSIPVLCSNAQNGILVQIVCISWDMFFTAVNHGEGNKFMEVGKVFRVRRIPVRSCQETFAVNKKYSVGS